jgi:hypothetical protein
MLIQSRACDAIVHAACQLLTTMVVFLPSPCCESSLPRACPSSACSRLRLVRAQMQQSHRRSAALASHQIAPRRSDV